MKVILASSRAQARANKRQDAFLIDLIHLIHLIHFGGHQFCLPLPGPPILLTPAWGIDNENPFAEIGLEWISRVQGFRAGPWRATDVVNPCAGHGFR